MPFANPRFSHMAAWEENDGEHAKHSFDDDVEQGQRDSLPPHSVEDGVPVGINVFHPAWSSRRTKAANADQGDIGHRWRYGGTPKGPATSDTADATERVPLRNRNQQRGRRRQEVNGMDTITGRSLYDLDQVLDYEEQRANGTHHFGDAPAEAHPRQHGATTFAESEYMATTSFDADTGYDENAPYTYDDAISYSGAAQGNAATAHAGTRHGGATQGNAAYAHDLTPSGETAHDSAHREGNSNTTALDQGRDNEFDDVDLDGDSDTAHCAGKPTPDTPTSWSAPLNVLPGWRPSQEEEARRAAGGYDSQTLPFNNLPPPLVTLLGLAMALSLVGLVVDALYAHELNGVFDSIEQTLATCVLAMPLLSQYDAGTAASIGQSCGWVNDTTSGFVLLEDTAASDTGDRNNTTVLRYMSAMAMILAVVSLLHVLVQAGHVVLWYHERRRKAPLVTSHTTHPAVHRKQRARTHVLVALPVLTVAFPMTVVAAIATAVQYNSPGHRCWHCACDASASCDQSDVVPSRAQNARAVAVVVTSLVRLFGSAALHFVLHHKGRRHEHALAAWGKMGFAVEGAGNHVLTWGRVFWATLTVITGAILFVLPSVGILSEHKVVVVPDMSANLTFKFVVACIAFPLAAAVFALIHARNQHHRCWQAADQRTKTNSAGVASATV
eukprot:m.494182 g.494182  ORF g.494182 m.494182 type:complete len:669 (+) comp39784_c0_seq1:91-2097(+)